MLPLLLSANQPEEISTAWVFGLAIVVFGLIAGTILSLKRRRLQKEERRRREDEKLATEKQELLKKILNEQKPPET